MKDALLLENAPTNDKIWSNTIMATTQEDRGPTLSDVKQATQALVNALQSLAQAKIHSTTDLIQEAYPNIEHSVRTLRVENVYKSIARFYSDARCRAKGWRMEAGYLSKHPSSILHRSN